MNAPPTPPRRPFQFSLRTMILCLVVGGAVLGVVAALIRAREDSLLTERIPKKYAAVTSVSLIEERRDAKDNGSEVLYLRLINPTRFAISYKGIAASNPFYQVQVLGTKRILPGNSKCGTGSRNFVIPPGRSLVFPVKSGGGTRVRVHCDLVGQGQTLLVWSKAIASSQASEIK